MPSGVIFSQAHEARWAMWMVLDPSRQLLRSRSLRRNGPVLYKIVRDKSAPGSARFEPHMIDNHSGAGSDLLAVDLNHDGKLDIVTSTRFGTFIFWGDAKQGREKK